MNAMLFVQLKYLIFSKEYTQQGNQRGIHLTMWPENSIANSNPGEEY